MTARKCRGSILLVVSVFFACGSTDDDDARSDAATDSSTQDTGIDCSLVGCGAPPLCSTGCTETCGCCACGEGEQMPTEGGTLVCTGGCYALNPG